MAGQDIHIAVAHEKGAGSLCTEVLHQGIDAGGVGLGGHIRAAAPDEREPTGAEVVCDDLPAERVCLVGKDGGLDAFGLQGVQQLRDAGVLVGIRVLLPVLLPLVLLLLLSVLLSLQILLPLLL